jgi:hypothetical protein
VDDVKCVHAQLADVLCRTGVPALGMYEENSPQHRGTPQTIGAAVLAHLAANNVDIRGCDSCKVQCDISVPKQVAKEQFWYQPSKNQLGNRKSRNARRIHQKHSRAKRCVMEDAQKNKAGTDSTLCE